MVNAADGSTGPTEVNAISNHIKGKNKTRLFAVGANETKIVTINVWLQKKPSADTDLTQNMSQEIAISDFGIISDLTPRHVTLLTTETWNVTGVTQYYYAWCWDATNNDPDRLYKLELDENEHYSFNYNGTYQHTLFIRSPKSDLTTENMPSSWDTTHIWNKTEDTAIPVTPVDPTYIIETMNGGEHSADINANKSTGSWHDPVNVNVDYVGAQTACGTLTATSYIGANASSHVIETTDGSSLKHKNTVHAWAGKHLKLTAAAATGYVFEGWFNNPDGENNGTDKLRLSTNATYELTAPSAAGTDVVYYAKFKEVRRLTIHKYVDGVNSSVAAGTITIGDTTSAASVMSFSKTVDKGSTVEFSATANTGYSLSGIFTTATGNNSAGSSVTLDGSDFETNYFAQFTTNSYNVTAQATYTTVGGTTYTSGDNGGTVQVNSAEAGASSVDSVKYKSAATLKATAASGYAFVGWFADSSGGTALSTDTSYSYTLNTAGAVTVYAKFMAQNTTTIYVAPRENWGDDYYVRLYVTGGANISGNTNGFVKADYDSSTGYYKATFSTTRSGKFYAILAKDTDYTDKVPADGGYEGDIGTDYLFKKGTEGIEQYTNKRCIWFIINQDGLKNNLKNDGDYLQVYVNNADTNMRRINDNAYVVELSNPSGAIYFKQYKSNNVKRNEWPSTVPSGQSQFRDITYTTGEWID